MPLNVISHSKGGHDAKSFPLRGIPKVLLAKFEMNLFLDAPRSGTATLHLAISCLKLRRNCGSLTNLQESSAMGLSIKLSTVE